jgi:hypothetical protein
MWSSRKFRLLVYDAVLAVIGLVITWFLDPIWLDRIVQLIGILQVPVGLVIGGIAYEDGQLKRASGTPIESPTNKE